MGWGMKRGVEVDFVGALCQWHPPGSVRMQAVVPAIAATSAQCSLHTVHIPDTEARATTQIAKNPEIAITDKNAASAGEFILLHASVTLEPHDARSV